MTSNPMSEASKAGLLKRMYADGADTFAKKVKWVAKHIPTITDPQAYVGWLTREERTSMATRNPTAEEHYDYGKRKLQQAKVELEAKGPKGEALTGKLRLSSLWVAYRLATMAENELHEGMNAKDTLKLIAEAGKVQKQAQQAIEAHLKGSKAKNPGPAQHLANAKDHLTVAKEELANVKNESRPKNKAMLLLSALSSAAMANAEANDAHDTALITKTLALDMQIRKKILDLVPDQTKNPAARSAAEMQHRKAVKKAAMHEAKVAGRAARATKKASGHNYVVCDSHGKAVALTTTLAEARKTVPKGGCIEKI